MTPIEIFQQVEQIRDMIKNGVDISEIDEKFPDFKSKYPILYDSAVSQKFDMQNFKFMIEQLQIMKDNKISQNTASEHVGTMLFDKYVGPRINQQKHQR
jgi:hypothetical protein